MDGHHHVNCKYQLKRTDLQYYLIERKLVKRYQDHGCWKICVKFLQLALLKGLLLALVLLLGMVVLHQMLVFHHVKVFLTINGSLVSSIKSFATKITKHVYKIFLSITKGNTTKIDVKWISIDST